MGYYISSEETQFIGSGCDMLKSLGGPFMTTKLTMEASFQPLGRTSGTASVNFLFACQGSVFCHLVGPCWFDQFCDERNIVKHFPLAVIFMFMVSNVDGYCLTAAVLYVLQRLKTYWSHATLKAFGLSPIISYGAIQK